MARARLITRKLVRRSLALHVDFGAGLHRGTSEGVHGKWWRHHRRPNGGAWPLHVGPEIAYRFVTGRTSFIEPQLSLQGLWNFDREENIVLDGLVGSPDAVTGRVEGRRDVRLRDGITFRATGAYEGVDSDDFSAWSGRVWGSVPLN